MEGGGTNGLDVDRGEQVLENGGHELELLILASESTENELCDQRTISTTL